jgi:hypothetical protein
LIKGKKPLSILRPFLPNLSYLNIEIWQGFYYKSNCTKELIMATQTLTIPVTRTKKVETKIPRTPKLQSKKKEAAKDPF